MKTHLLVFFFLFTTLSYAQEIKTQVRGHINKRGYFEFTDYKTQLDYLDMVKKEGIRGDSYFYFTVFDKKNGKKDIVVINTNTEFATNKIKKYSSLKAGYVTSNFDYELTKCIVNDSIYNKISKLSEDEFFSKYVYENKEIGGLEIIKDREIEKAVLLRLLKKRIPVFITEASGDVALPKYKISW